MPSTINTDYEDVHQTASDQEGKDVSEVYADTPENRKKVSEHIERNMRKARRQRNQFEREWFRAVLYYSGNQWIRWDRDKQLWRKKRGPKWWPKPMTNVLANKVDANVSALTGEEPNVSWVPATDDVSDIAAANVADRIDETIAEEVGRRRKARLKATWAALTGGCFVESYYDNDPSYGEAFIQAEQCIECGFVSGPSKFKTADGSQCPECESLRTQPAKEVSHVGCTQCPYSTDDESLAGQECPACAMEAQASASLTEREGAMGTIEEGPYADPDPETEPPTIGVLERVYTDEKIGMNVPRGKVCERVRSPFEIFFDHTAVDEFSEGGGVTWAAVVEMVDKEVLKTKYDIPEDIGQGSRSGSENTSLSMLYKDNLATLTNLVEAAIGYYGQTTSRGSGSGDGDDRWLREVMYELPTKKFPKGLMATRINGESGEVVEFGPLEYTDSKDKPFIPIVHIKFKDQPGRAWGKSFVTDIIPLQDQRNQTEAMMVLSERRMANPVWKLPRGVVDRDPSGEPGEFIWYNPFTGGGQGRQPLPEREQGIEPGQYFKYRLEELDKQIERIAGSYGISQGEAPPGITAASALQLLAERQARSANPQVSAWELAHEQAARQQMHIFRKFAVDDRVRVRKGDNSRWQIEKWSSADLSGEIDATVEVGSAAPKSMAQRKAQIEGLIGMGVINPMDPEQNYRILQKFGEAEFFSHIQEDVLDAQRENERFMRFLRGEEGGKPPRLRELFDNHERHIQEHLKLGKTEDYIEMEERAKTDDRVAIMLEQYEAHIQEHMQIVQQAMMEQQAAEQEAQEPQRDGPGRPEGSGKNFDRGVRAPNEEESRAVSEPGGMGVQEIQEPTVTTGAMR